MLESGYGPAIRPRSCMQHWTGSSSVTRWPSVRERLSPSSRGAHHLQVLDHVRTGHDHADDPHHHEGAEDDDHGVIQWQRRRNVPRAADRDGWLPRVHRLTFPRSSSNTKRLATIKPHTFVLLGQITGGIKLQTTQTLPSFHGHLHMPYMEGHIVT